MYLFIKWISNCLTAKPQRAAFKSNCHWIKLFIVKFLQRWHLAWHYVTSSYMNWKSVYDNIHSICIGVFRREVFVWTSWFSCTLYNQNSFQGRQMQNVVPRHKKWRLFLLSRRLHPWKSWLLKQFWWLSWSYSIIWASTVMLRKKSYMKALKDAQWSKPQKKRFYFCMWYWWTATRKPCVAPVFTFSKRHWKSDTNRNKKNWCIFRHVL